MHYIMCFIIMLFSFTSACAEEIPPLKSIEDAPYLLVIQDFLKFGKSDAFEAVNKNLLQYRKGEGAVLLPPMLVVQGLTLPQYLTLIALNGYEDIPPLLKGFAEFKQAAGPDIQMFASTINYRIFSLHAFRKELSYLPSTIKTSYADMPYLYYVIYSVRPGREEDFEAHLQTVLTAENESKPSQPNFCWRVWKVTFGGDVPKYIVGLFTAAEKVIDDKKEKILFKSPSLEDVIRRTQEGKGKIRLDLSSLPSHAIPSDVK